VCYTSVGRKKEGKKKEKRKEVFDIRKRRKGTNISTYQTERKMESDECALTLWISTSVA
jgi:hypothetical protein